MGRGIRSLVVLVLVLAFAASGCGDSSDSGASGSSKTTADAPKSGGALIGESSPIASNPNVHAVSYGGEEAAKQLGWGYRVLDANLSPDKQVSDIDTLINLGVKGLITLTLDPGAADAAYKRASDAGIPLVGINSESQYIQTNIAEETDTTCVPGEDAAKFIADRVDGAKVLVIGGPPVPSIRLRTDCFVKAAKKNGLEIVEQQDNLKDTAATAQPIVENMLTKNPDIDAIFAYNDPSALGAAAVLKGAGKDAWSGDKEGIIVIGINATADAIDAIKSGVMTATYDPNSAQAGAAAVAALALVLKDKKPSSAMPKKIVIKTKRWDIDNADEYVEPFKREITLPEVK
jgi:ribose transport system substrate-binding protein